MTASENPAPRGALGPARYDAPHIILATGASPRILPGLEPDGRLVWTYVQALRPAAVPASLVIVGSGAIGVEFASIYAAMGSRVTLVELAPRILPSEDDEIAGLMAKALQKRGITLHTGVAVQRLDRHTDSITAHLSDGTAVSADRLLSAAGVVPNVSGLGLDALGVVVRHGAVETTAAGRTNLPGLYAIGDLAGPPMLAHKAEHDGIACVEAIAGRARGHHGPIPACIYASPQIASVGMTEAQAGPGARVGRFSLRGNGKALVLGEPDGLVKCVFDAQDRLVGAQIIGAEASELIHGLTIAVSLGPHRRNWPRWSSRTRPCPKPCTRRFWPPGTARSMPDQPRGTVIFDLDGTLVDSALDLADALDWLLADMGFAPLGPDRVRQLIGHGVAELVRRGLEQHGQRPDPEDLALAVQRFLKRYTAHLSRKSKTLPRRRRSLDRAAPIGWRLAVCTNKLEASARGLLQDLGLCPPSRWSPARHFRRGQARSCASAALPARQLPRIAPGPAGGRFRNRHRRSAGGRHPGDRGNLGLRALSAGRLAARRRGGQPVRSPGRGPAPDRVLTAPTGPHHASPPADSSPLPVRSPGLQTDNPARRTQDPAAGFAHHHARE